MEIAVTTRWIWYGLLSSLPAVSGCYTRPAVPTPSAKAKAAPARSPQKTLDEMQQTIERDVAAGFSTPDEIERNAIEIYSDDMDPASLRPQAKRFRRDALAKHAAAQATWPTVTDCDRLDKAFAELEQRGIVARQNFSDCGTCGAAEIGDEIDATRKKGREVRGYVFYHMQDTESAAEGYGLYLNYGSVGPDEKAALKIAAEAVESLKRQGLETNWNGSIRQRIGVKLDWKRRRSS
jgi:hypothetical protein